ncbi:MAG: SRPBCC family protein [Ignavibacteria bacterium]|nr:SRPBCC family protein [Ignavibacteria bacterium]
MKLHKLERIQIIKSDIESVWKFFSRPENLNDITPPDMNFEILTKDLPDEIYPGLIIQYKVSPFGGIKFNWVTEIKHVIPKKLFVDEQIFGPYKFWHHLHFFEEIDKNTIKMTDRVYYKLPFLIFGELAHAFIIRKRLNEIFDYRFETINKIFNEM